MNDLESSLKITWSDGDGSSRQVGSSRNGEREGDVARV